MWGETWSDLFPLLGKDKLLSRCAIAGLFTGIKLWSSVFQFIIFTRCSHDDWSKDITARHAHEAIWRFLRPVLQTCVNFNPSMHKLSRIQQTVGWNHLFIPKCQRWGRWNSVMYEQFHPKLYISHNSIYMLGLKSIHVSKARPRSLAY